MSASLNKAKMCVRKGFYCVILLQVFSACQAGARECGAPCSRARAPECALVAAGGALDVRRYHNRCHLNKIQCLLKKKFFVIVILLPDYYCGVESGAEKSEDGRRYVDNTIMGGRNFCNHTCPTHCVDIYEPVCGQVWFQGNRKPNKIFVNHCHADMYSCTMQLSLVLQSIDYCLGSMTQFAYSALTQAATLKRLGLINV